MVISEAKGEFEIDVDNQNAGNLLSKLNEVQKGEVKNSVWRVGMRVGRRAAGRREEEGESESGSEIFP